jgi:hypothetical protein
MLAPSSANRRPTASRAASARVQAATAVTVPSGEPRHVGAAQHADLPRHGLEELLRGHGPRHQRRDAPQRRLLVCQPRRQACLALRPLRQHADRERGGQEGREDDPVVQSPGSIDSRGARKK